MTSATFARADRLTVTETTQFTDEQKARLLACSPTERAVLIGEPTDADLEPIIAYVRISDDREGRQAGIERQLLDLMRLARGRRGRIIAVYADHDIGASDHTRKVRPEYQAMMREAPTSIARTVAAYTSNRLTRRPTEHEDQIRLSRTTGVRFVYCASPAFDLDTSAGRRVARILAATDAGEAEDISERVIRAKVQHAVDGVYSGGSRPFGYRITYDYGSNGLPIKPGRLVIDEREAALIRDAVHRFLAGESLASIAARWDAAGVSTRSGKPWNPVSVRGILGRGRNAGLSERHGEVMGTGQWPAIISEDELAAVRARLGDPDRKTHHGDYSRRWLGSGLYLCGQPGCTSKIRSTGQKAGDSRGRYCCREAGHCVINDAELVDAHVRMEVAHYLAKHGAALLAGSQGGERTRLTEEANTIRGKIDALAAAFAEDDRSDARAFAVATRSLETRIAAIEKQQALLIVPENTLAGIADAEDPARAFLDATLDRQRAIVDVLFTITITPGRRGRQPAGSKLTDRVLIEPRLIAG
jgi:site-specific DNA recombinase